MIKQVSCVGGTNSRKFQFKDVSSKRPLSKPSSQPSRLPTGQPSRTRLAAGRARLIIVAPSRRHDENVSGGPVPYFINCCNVASIDASVYFYDSIEWRSQSNNTVECSQTTTDNTGLLIYQAFGQTTVHVKCRADAPFFLYLLVARFLWRGRAAVQVARDDEEDKLLWNRKGRWGGMRGKRSEEGERLTHDRPNMRHECVDVQNADPRISPTPRVRKAVQPLNGTGHSPG